MTTIERLAKLAFEKMLSTMPYELRYGPYTFKWEDEPQTLRDQWIATVRAVVGEMREPPLPPRTPPGLSGGLVTPPDYWRATIDAILEEKS